MATEKIELIEALAYADIRDSFADELTRAIQGEQTSLPFIRNQLPARPLVEPGEVFQSFVIGGTNGEVASLRYEADGHITILDHTPCPDLDKFTSVEALLAFIDGHVDDSTNAIGISFAAELIPTTGGKGQLDGILNEGETKGHGFHGLQQQHVGKTIEDHFFHTHKRELIVSVGNDTVALLAAMAVRGVDRSNVVAGIVGTGYNIALFSDDHTIVNVQASDFSGFSSSSSGRLVDQRSTNRGEQLYDKEVAKLFAHYNVLIDTGALHGASIKNNKELAAISEKDDLSGEVARALFRRSAALIAAQFAGLYHFKDKPERLSVVMQGSLYWKAPHYQSMVANELENLGISPNAIAFEKLKHADILGAATLVTGGL
jgi:hexokinase